MRKRKDQVSHLRKAGKKYHCFSFQHFITIRISIFQYFKAFFRYSMMMMMMMNCFCDIFYDDNELLFMNCFCFCDQRKVFSLFSSWNYCQRSSPSWISDTSWVGFEPVQNLNSGLVEWRCAVVITTSPRRLHVSAGSSCDIVFPVTLVTTIFLKKALAQNIKIFISINFFQLAL